MVHIPYPKGPCAQIVYTLGPMYIYRDDFKAKVYTIRVHGPVGIVKDVEPHFSCHSVHGDVNPKS